MIYYVPKDFERVYSHIFTKYGVTGRLFLARLGIKKNRSRRKLVARNDACALVLAGGMNEL
jgi:hypothetical protein